MTENKKTKYLKIATIVLAVLLVSVIFTSIIKLDFGVSANPNTLDVTIVGPQELGVNQTTTYSASVNSSVNFAYLWTISPTNDITIASFGNQCNLTFTQAVEASKFYVLSVSVQENGMTKGFDAITVHDPVTLPDYYLDTSTADYSYKIATDNLGGYYCVNGTSGQVVNGWTSTNAKDVFNTAISVSTIGSTIAVQSGSYVLSSPIVGTNKDNITLSFAVGATIFLANNMNLQGIFLTGCNNWLISGVPINGNSANQVGTNGCGIVLNNCTNCHVDQANIYNCKIFGFQITGPANKNGITNSKLINNCWNGITLGDASGVETGLYAINNEVAYSGDVGITNYGTGNIVTGNYIHDMNGTSGYNNSHFGIAVEGGSSDLIAQNIIQNCGDGINIGTWNNNTITDNTITSATNTDVIGVFSQRGIVLSGWGGHCMYNIVEGNHITGMRPSDWSTGGVGIMIQDGASFNTIKDNIVSQSGLDGIELTSGCDNNTVISNSFSQSALGSGMKIFSKGNTVSLNSVFDNPASGIDVFGNNNFISQNQVYSDNVVAQYNGIVVEYGATTNLLINNNAYANTGQQIADNGTYTVTNAIYQVVTVGQNVVGGQVLFYNSSWSINGGSYYLANAVSNAGMGSTVTTAIACQNVTAGNQCLVMTSGLLTNPHWAWTVGGSIYVSASSSGSQTQTMPLASGNIDQYTGYATATNQMLFAPNSMTISR